MKKRRKKPFNKTEESIFTLLSLYVLINQAFESLTKNEDILLSEFDKAKSTFKDLVNDTIHEALVYQILLKSCAFLDEWNKIFGVHTEPEDKNKILSLKRIAKPALKCVSKWKNLRDFRNEAIAHNHRNKEGRNIYLNYVPYHSPQTAAEIYLLVFCLNKMMHVVRFFFNELLEGIVKHKIQGKKIRSEKVMRSKKVKARIRNVDDEITSSLMKIQILSGVMKNVDGKATVTILV